MHLVLENVVSRAIIGFAFWSCLAGFVERCNTATRLCAGVERLFAGGAIEVYSRVVGYMRPVSQWNEAKQLEFEERKMFARQTFEVFKTSKVLGERCQSQRL